MKIYITRHGETMWNKQGRMQGWNNSNLTEKGVDNAKKLGKALKDIPFDTIYCSPLGRAVETAECIVGERKIPIILEDNLKEMNFGTWEGMTHDNVKTQYPDAHFKLWNTPEVYEPVDGEDFETLLGRARKVLEMLVSLENIENILVISHAIFIKAFYVVAKDYTLKELWNPPFMRDTCLSILEIENGNLQFILEGDTSHLQLD